MSGIPMLRSPVVSTGKSNEKRHELHTQLIDRLFKWEPFNNGSYAYVEKIAGAMCLGLCTATTQENIVCLHVDGRIDVRAPFVSKSSRGIPQFEILSMLTKRVFGERRIEKREDSLVLTVGGRTTPIHGEWHRLWDSADVRQLSDAALEQHYSELVHNSIRSARGGITHRGYKTPPYEKVLAALEEARVELVRRQSEV